jgi:hypothetical protein
MYKDPLTWLSKFAANDYLVGAASLLILLFVLRGFFKRHLVLVSSSGFGRVRMSRRALYSVIYVVINNIEGVSAQHVKLDIRGGKIHINADIKLNICRNIAEITGDVQSRLSDVFVHDLGLDNIGLINIVVGGFSRKSRKNIKFLSENCCEHRAEDGSGEAS